MTMRLIFVWIACFGITASGFAAGLIVSPMEQYVHPGKPVLYETTNKQNRAIAVEVIAEEWNISEDGEELRTLTQDLVVFPNQFILKGHSSKRVKVVPRSRKALSMEKAYRVTIRELPISFDLAEKERTRIYMANAYRTSFYLLPSKQSKDVAFVDAVVEEQSISVRFHNRGSIHTYLLEPELVIELADGSQRTIDDFDILKVINGKNLHANMTRSFTFDLSKMDFDAKIQSVTLKLRHEEGGRVHSHKLR